MEWIMRAERAVEKVREKLIKTCRALEGAGVPYVVIGGNAVAVWVGSRDEGAIRNTKDVDILLNRADLELAREAMSKAGFGMAEVDGITMFLDRDDPMSSRGVHVVFAGEKIKPHDRFPAPAVVKGIRSPDGVDAIELRELMILKLIAFRDIDRVHIRDMLKVGLINDVVADEIPDELRPRLEEIRANPDG
jgi:predicted nucleotidyltransferase